MTETGLTHVDAAGQARMVDVSGKDVTARSACATGRVLLSAGAVAALRAGEVPKGDALAVARIAGIAGAKRTPDLIPLCHPIGLHAVNVEAEVTGPLRSPPGRRSFARGVLDRSAGRVTPLTGQQSHQVATLARANALITVPESATQLAAGETADVLILP